MNLDPGAVVPHPPGWYLDETAGSWRWWDGLEWKNVTRSRTDSRLRPLLTPSSYRIDRSVQCGAAIGLAFAGTVTVVTVVTGRAALDIGVLALGMPFVFAFQFWLLYVLRARYPRRREVGYRVRVNGRRPNTFAFFFKPIPIVAAVALVAVFVIAWLIAASSFIGTSGGAERGPAGCPYRLNDHGEYTCVSRATYERARSRDGQELAAVMSAFFAVHIAGASGELNRRRSEGPSPTAIIP